MFTRVSAAVVLSALVVSNVEAHGELMLPRPTYPKWGGGVTSTISPSVMPFAWRQDFPQAFDEAIAKTGLSLKDFIMKYQNVSGASDTGSTAECGYSDPKGTPQPLPDKIQFHTGFMHWGPCEAYCDNVLVTKHAADCKVAYPGGAVPYDKAKCAGKKQFKFYWLGMDSGNSAPWQAYVNCVPLSGAGASSDNNASDADADTDAEPTSSTPAASTKAPVKDTPATTSKPTTSAPKPASSAPAPTNAAPSGKCTRRQRN